MMSKTAAAVGWRHNATDQKSKGVDFLVLEHSHRKMKMRLASSRRACVMMLVFLLGSSVVHAFLPCLAQPLSKKKNRNLTVVRAEGKNDSTPMVSRRSMFAIPFLGVVAAVTTGISKNDDAAFALDMDAFVRKELETDSGGDASSSRKKPPTEDEALCISGSPSKARGEACVRAGMPTKASKNGGVDAFGKVDRGDYIRCVTTYELPNDAPKYERVTVCK
mmetsp:Transcript_12980/g.23512  ORF Transcript_12980/g.23512 Transcript_12980/m.23512 type:complete len:220 (-) Transcript_12980:294-953(-)